MLKFAKFDDDDTPCVIGVARAVPPRTRVEC